MIGDLESMNVYEGLDPTRNLIKKSKTIVRRNKRAVSNYSTMKRAQSAKHFKTTNMRIKSASQKKLAIIQHKQMLTERKLKNKEGRILNRKKKHLQEVNIWRKA
jgi:hypothetical protein